MKDFVYLFDDDIKKDTIKFSKISCIILSIIVIILLIVGIFNKYVFVIGLAFVITPIAAFGDYLYSLNRYGQLVKIENNELYVYKYNKKFKFKINFNEIIYSTFNVLLGELGPYGSIKLERECLVLHFNELEKWRFYKENVIDYRYCNKDNSVVVIHNKVLTEFIMKNYVFKNQCRRIQQKV